MCSRTYTGPRSLRSSAFSTICSGCGVERAKVLARALRCHPAVLVFRAGRSSGNLRPEILWRGTSARPPARARCRGSDEPRVAARFEFFEVVDPDAKNSNRSGGAAGSGAAGGGSSAALPAGDAESLASPELGQSYCASARRLGVDDKTVAKSVRWLQSIRSDAGARDVSFRCRHTIRGIVSNWMWEILEHRRVSRKLSRFRSRF